MKRQSKKSKKAASTSSSSNTKQIDIETDTKQTDSDSTDTANNSDTDSEQSGGEEELVNIETIQKTETGLDFPLESQPEDRLQSKTDTDKLKTSDTSQSGERGTCKVLNNKKPTENKENKEQRKQKLLADCEESGFGLVAEAVNENSNDSSVTLSGRTTGKQRKQSATEMFKKTCRNQYSTALQELQTRLNEVYKLSSE